MQLARIPNRMEFVLRKYIPDCNLSRQTCPPFIYCNSPDEIDCQMIYFLELAKCNSSAKKNDANEWLDQGKYFTTLCPKFLSLNFWM